jgi:hypothetical protein
MNLLLTKRKKHTLRIAFNVSIAHEGFPSEGQMYARLFMSEVPSLAGHSSRAV